MDAVCHCQNGVLQVERGHALWKAKLRSDTMMETDIPEFRTKKAKIDHVDSARRQEKRIMSGSSIVIENVLPFLKSVA
jgi:hypothetical protein